MRKDFLWLPLFLLLLAAAITCRSAKTPDTQVQIQGKDSVLTAIDRGACFGRCPDYYACVSKSKTAWYRGRRNVKKTGLWKSPLTEAQYQEVLDLLRNYRVEQWDSAYINPYLADFPAYQLWVSDQKPLKRILVNHEAPPEDVTAFTKRLEGFFDRLRWEQVSPADTTQE